MDGDGEKEKGTVDPERVKITEYVVMDSRGVAHVFKLDERYEVISQRALGSGAYGVVCKAKHVPTGDEVAIKKIKSVFEHQSTAKRTMRELKIMHHLQHDNCLGLRDVIPILEPVDAFAEIYIVVDLMDSDIQNIIHSPTVMGEQHLSYFMYQILAGLKYLHSAKILHRDLKPANLLVNSDSTVKVCDFGLARVDDAAIDGESAQIGLKTDYVCTRWYRAPEIICDRTMYTEAVDMWSAGVILAEMSTRTVLLKGGDQVQQLARTMDLVGTPSPEQIARIKNTNARKYVEKSKNVPRKDLSTLFPNLSANGIDLIDKLLTWDPAERITAREALEHPFVQDFRDEESEIDAEEFDFDAVLGSKEPTITEAREHIYDLMMKFYTVNYPSEGVEVA